MLERLVSVLIAVKDFSERKHIRNVLEENFQENLTVHEVFSEEKILEICNKENILIAVIDTEIADRGAVDAIKRLYERNEECKVIILTDSEKISTYEQVKLPNVLDYILRPYEKMGLVTAMEYAIVGTKNR